jgi:predicted hydrocarbon binding protein
MAELKYVITPDEYAPVFSKAERMMEEYFATLKLDPERSAITLKGADRYSLIFAADFSYYLQKSFRDKFGGAAQFILYEMAYQMGRQDCIRFCENTGAKDPIDRLAAGPVYFSFTGMARVEILPLSRPSPDKDYILVYYHHYSFEAESYLAHGEKTEHPVCFMSAGYSAGWCSVAFGLDLKAEELSCRAMGGERCLFVMAPPRHLVQRIAELRSPGGVGLRV